MGILLIDSSSKKIEFGYGHQKSSKLLIEEELDQKHNADALTYFINKAFIEKKIDLKEIEYVSLSNGPGSFTGLRIGSAIAKGICFALQSKLIEIPALDIVANKFKLNFSGAAEKEIISLIFSNTKTREFYFCRYRVEHQILNRISDYKTGVLENILVGDHVFVINEWEPYIEKGYIKKLTDVSGFSNLESQYNLTEDYISKNNFSDFGNSEPFYMKDFFPVSK
ncbi:MAG: tRNA (adenosine(37)-N6)-threonylcarbamoyltransferase complex dimerization subunit type 1 TsaB [Ignavibacteria bacterium]|nr:tRNA (adenosine(37)-N6)-threonylcarbamoyltransferase complex dimerization subunit type 1 TsaB [Ignavibacteria bacterium]